MEVLRWGLVQIPAAVYHYASELDLEPEDLGVLGAAFYSYTHRCQPLLQKGIEIGQIMQCYPSLSKNKLAWRISKWNRLGLIAMDESTQDREFAARRISLAPIFCKLEELVARDHPEIDVRELQDERILKQELEKSHARIQELEQLLGQKRQLEMDTPPSPHSSGFKMVADFISQKTGNLIGPEMHKAINRWLNDFNCKPEYLIIMLELCFERNIYEPREITTIARGLREASITNLRGMQHYFRNIVDKPEFTLSRRYDLAMEVMEFGNFTGISMQGEARKKIYEKWRMEWGFSQEMVMKAGEIMSQRTKNGGLDYVDKVLANWRSKDITTLAEVERDSNEFRKRAAKRAGRLHSVRPGSADHEEAQIYVAPHVLEELKSKKA